MERETGIEPAKASLGSWCSTIERLPHGSIVIAFKKEVNRSTLILQKVIRCDILLLWYISVILGMIC